MSPTPSSRNDHFGYLSPPPNYQHSPPSTAASFSSFQFTLAPAHPPHQSQSTRSPGSQQRHGTDSTAKHRHQHQLQQDEHYLAKYRDMKQKVQELELDNDRLHLKCLVVRKNIQRLRLERAILYERLQTMGGSAGGSLATNPVPHSDNHQHRVPPRHDSNPSNNYEQPPISQFQSTFMVKHTSARSPKVSSSSNNKKRSNPTTATTSSAPAIIIDELSPGQNQDTGVTTTTTATTPIIPENGPAVPPSPTLHQVRNGNFMRTFPFVHEYSSSSSSSATHKHQRQSTPIHSEYPVEIKFHQYEAGTPDQRNSNSRRDRERDGGDDGKPKRRGPSGSSQDLNRTQYHHHPQQSQQQQRSSSSKRNAQTSAFRGPSQFTYSFQVQPTPPENASPTQSQMLTR